MQKTFRVFDLEKVKIKGTDNYVPNNANIPYFIINLVGEIFRSEEYLGKNLDKMYENNKHKAYELAKNSVYYNYPAFNEADIEYEFMCKKILGLVLLAETDSQIKDDFFMILIANYKKLINRISKNKKLTWKVFNDEYRLWGDNKYLFSALAMHYRGYMILFFSRNLNIEPEYEDKKVNKVLKNLSLDASQIYLGLLEENPIQFSFKDKAIKFRDRIEDSIGMKISSVDSLQYFHHDYESFESASKEIGGKNDKVKRLKDNKLSYSIIRCLPSIFSTYGFDLSKLFDNVDLNDEDILKVCDIYYSENKNLNRQNGVVYLFMAVLIVSFLKAYRNVKEFHFQNNIETQFIKIQKYKNEAEDYQNKIEDLRINNEKLINENHYLRTEKTKEYGEKINHFEILIRKMRKKINTLEEEIISDQVELNALREEIFNLNHNDFKKSYEEITIPSVKGVIIGGSIPWQTKLSKKLPESFKFINLEHKHVHKSIFQDCEYFVYYTDFLSHDLYYKTINYCKKNDGKIIYLRNTNTELVIEELYQKIN